MPYDSTSDAARFEQIVADHQAMVFRVLARLTGRSDALEDLAQDVFLRLFRALPNFRGDALLSTYLYRIAVNVAHNEYKRRRNDRRNISLSAPVSHEDDAPTLESRLPHPGSNALDQLAEAEFAAIVQQQLHQLKPLEQSVLVLYHQEERSYEQIATILALPIGTVRTHLHRGRTKLREALLKGGQHA